MVSFASTSGALLLIELQKAASLDMVFDMCGSEKEMMWVKDQVRTTTKYII